MRNEKPAKYSAGFCYCYFMDFLFKGFSGPSYLRSDTAFSSVFLPGGVISI
jgi:hypothetical protein